MIDSVLMLRSWSGDFVVLVIFLIAGYFGFGRSFRISLFQFLIQLLSIVLTYFIATTLTTKAIQYVPSQLTLDLVIPDSLFYLVQPHEDIIIPLIIFIIIYLLVFVVIKSFLYVFGRNYEWDQYFFKKLHLNAYVENGMSASFTILNAYTYVMVLLVILGFPLFNLVSKQSLSAYLLKNIPFVSPYVEQFYTPYEVFNQAVMAYEGKTHLIFDGSTMDLAVIEQLIQSNPSQRMALQDTYKFLIPYLATSRNYLSQFSSERVGADEMKAYLTKMNRYLDNQVITLEIFNSYYEELINNKTYDKLIEDEVITDEALTILVNSGTLNDSNLKKFKEYLALD